MVGCAGSTYYLDVSPRYQTIDTDFFPSYVYSEFNGGNPITHVDYKVYESGLKGTGGQVSLIEVNKYLYSRLGYHFNKLSSDRFSYSLDDSTPTPGPMELNTSGFDAEVGLKLWHFMPHISAIYSDMEFKGRPDLSQLLPEHNAIFSDYISYIAFGLAIDIPISKHVSILLNSQIANTTQTYSVGLMFGGWQPFPPEKERQEKRR
jgi:hypothetical protein